MEQKLEKLRDQLSDLSKKNRSLRLLRLYDKWSLDLSTLRQLEKTKSATAEKVIDSILHNKDSIFLLGQPSGEDEGAKVFQQLTSLHRNITTIKEQTGVEDLYVGYPFVSGKMADGTFIQAPVFLFPVRLLKQGGKEPGWTLQIESKEEVLLNRTLLLAFQKYNGLRIDEEILEDAKDMPTEGFEQWTSELFQRYGIDLYWARRKIMPVHQYRQKELPNSPDNFLAVTPYCVLGYFSQGNTSLLKDYDELLEQYKQDQNLGLVHELLEDEIHHTWVDMDVDLVEERHYYNVTELDFSQEEALLNTNEQEGIVVHGPPGTGKSQLIVNLIASAMANNEKVLLVCQKRAALDVVYQRLEMLGLHEQVALVHDVNGDRKGLYQKVNTLLSQKGSTSRENKQKQYEEICKDLDHRKEYFAQIAKALSEKGSFGFTGYELYTQLGLLEQSIPWLPTQGFRSMNKKQLETLASTMELLGDYIGRFGYKNHLWYHRKSLASKTYQDLHALEETMALLIENLDLLYEFKKDEITEVFSPQDCWENNISIQAGMVIVEKYKKPSFLKHMKLRLWSMGKGKKLLQKWQSDFNPFRQTTEDWIVIEEKIRHLQAYGEHAKKVYDQIKGIEDYYQYHQIQKWLTQIEEGEYPLFDFSKAKEQIKQEFDSLVAMDQVFESLTPEAKIFFEFLQKDLPEEQTVDLGERWKSITYKSFYMRGVDELEANYPVLKSLSTGEYENHWQAYKRLLDEKRQQLPAYLKEQVRLPVEKMKKGQIKEYREIQHQVNKTRKVWPIRKLMHHYWEDGILDILPIWLVSPETVSTIFPLQKGLFDKVIFDEASQCTVEHGIPSFYRGQKVIVAGDEKQLAPFDLFQVGLDIEEEEVEDTIQDSPSLLALTKKQYPTQLLAWHYRSNYEELIHFSNYAYYQGEIQIAPNVWSVLDPPPIEWRAVEGIWEDQTNMQEALAVCTEIKEIFRSQPEQSLGVITFNKKQQDLIIELMDQQLQEDEEFANLYDQMMKKGIDERLFIKNIENVQGDERDLIIFSVGYGKNPEGRVSVNFGILNKAGGENRLNVAVSRAKEKMIIFCSVHPMEFDVSQSKNAGPHFFQQYLQYAYAIAHQNKEKAYQILDQLEDVQISQGQLGEDMKGTDAFIDQVTKALQKRGYDVHTSVGNSKYKVDVAVIHPNDPTRYILGVQTDGAMYQNAQSVKEREIYHQRFLESKGWNILRIWSRNWWKDQDGEIKKIEDYIESCM
ncbi:MAG: DUF4011 domain-containing protein [Epulopiscium sp.]|nr:DUF4011 domain-containing protein [Candidatus Epulonipiscium sp.]